MNAKNDRISAHERQDPAGAALLALLVIVVSAAAIWPALCAFAEVARGLLKQGPVLPQAGDTPWAWFDGSLWGRSIAWAGLIAALGTLLAVPLAWSLRGSRGAALAILLVPMLMPAYLAYAGYGLARAPGTWLGDHIERLAQSGWAWLPAAVGRWTAALGLALWAAPVAALVLLPAARRVTPATLDALSLAGAGPARRAWQVLRMLRGGLWAAFLVASLVMLGSAVPLHLNQIDTYAIRTWLGLDLTPRDQRWTVWLASWPLLVAAIVAAIFAVRYAASFKGHGVAGQEEPRPRPLVRLAGLAVPAAGALVPWIILLSSVRGSRFFWLFWRTSGEPLLFSLEVGAMAALGAVVIGAGVWFGVQRGGVARTLALACTGVLVALGVLPGVLVGSWTIAAWHGTLGEWGLIVVLAHLARFGFLPALLGCWAAGLEPVELSDARRLTGGSSLAGWWAASLRPGLGMLVACGLAVLALSLHEIEAGVLVAPAGRETIARQMLGFLHYSRMDELSAAGSWLIGLGVLVALASAWIGRARYDTKS